MTLAIAQSTPTGAAIAGMVSKHYPFGEVAECELLRRSFNQVYGLEFSDGRRAVARLSAERPRGDPKIGYEAALLGHLRARNVPVADCLRTSSGATAVMVTLPEGERPLMLFEHLDGEMTGEALPDVEAFGRGLAMLHEAADDFVADQSHYTLDLSYLLESPLQRLLAAPTMTEEMQTRFTELGSRLHHRISAMEGLMSVVCHGDAHGQNNFVSEGQGQQRIASFFDFDDAGPGYLAFELAVYAWSMHPRTTAGQFDEKALARWHHFISAYRTVRPLPAVDLQAVPSFMAVRHFWLLGEYAGRIPVWGSQAMPTAYLRKQLEMLKNWETLTIPESQPSA
ncbi:phosphotransferase enzyme family protein [Polaromonas sp. A23]|uniref:phosphotransferase enzyme family protein n=1 Tax=Polaromonas sp. A23 TaxID=1944133 RepID=UPI000984A283|nr:phosphotransferase [Polaromonas sp. A23]OOG36798.1 aminoglycoside phosphotransferase [Polaromonas sp. A23]